MRIGIGILLAGLAGAVACDDESGVLRLAGTYNLIVLEQQDTCDDDQNQYAATVTVEQNGEFYTVRFGDQATLNGALDADGILQASGTSMVPVVVDGQTVVVTADMVMQLGLLQTGDIEASGILTYDGTFPGVEGQCFQIFVAEGDRTSSSLAPLGPGA